MSRVLSGFNKKTCVFYMVITIIALSQIVYVDTLLLECSDENSKFLCDNSRCIWSAWKCDGEDDCHDNSDEKGCDAKTCSAEQFKCLNGACISKSWTCDGQDDCHDNSDESKTLCENRDTCTNSSFHCSTGDECVSSLWLCDGEEDCGDGSDEKNCTLPACLADEFLCGSECVTDRWRCDGEVDCDKGTDEENCDFKPCPDTNFMCVDAGDQRCIPESWKCDEEEDCSDGSDELNCPKPNRSCPTGYFVCEVKKPSCIMLSWVCDGQDDCSDGADERNCSNSHQQCLTSQFACDIGNCISKTKACDGKDDCANGSDEKDCPSVIPSSCDSPQSYKCSDGKCILMSQLCDHRADCRSGEDEVTGHGKCFFDECQVDNGNCSDICVNTHYSYKCECSSGYRLDSDGYMCDDINECVEQNPCEQLCLNLKGTYKCFCHSEYKMEAGVCKSLYPDSLSLMVAERTKIKKIRLDPNIITYPPSRLFSPSHFVPVFASGLKRVAGLAVDVKNKLLYWAQDGQIVRGKTGDFHTRVGPPVQILSAPLIQNPTSLSLDWINRHLYWIDSTRHTVSVSYENGTWPVTLIKNMNQSNYLVVHPGRGYLFINAICEDTMCMQRYSMDGTNKNDIITTAIVQPIGLTIDYHSERLYWIDGKLNKIASSNFDGGNTMVVTNVYNILQHPFGLAVTIDRVYWTDIRNGNVYSCNKRTGLRVQTIVAHFDLPSYIVADTPVVQPYMDDLCAGNTCQFMCIPVPPTNNTKGYTCVCPDGYELSITSTCTKTAQQTSEAVTGISATTKIGLIIGVCASVALLVFLVYFVSRWLQRRSLRLSMNFDNPVYRKTTTTNREENGGPRLVEGITRSGSKDNLVDNEVGEGSERRGSIESGENNEHVYDPVNRVSTEADDGSSQISFNISDERSLIS